MKAVILCLAIMLSYALLAVANNDTASNTTMSPSVTEEEGANGTTSKPETTTSGYSIVLPSVMFVGAANILQRFI